MRLKLYFRIIVATFALVSCSKDDPIPDQTPDPEPTPAPVVTLKVTDNDDGTYYLDASESKHAEEIKWEIPEIIASPEWTSFASDKTKTITVPDKTKDYTVKVYVRNETAEKSTSKTLDGKEPEVKYSNFESLDEMLANPYIKAAVDANSFPVYHGDSPSALNGVYSITKKRGQRVNVSGSVSEYEESPYLSEKWCGLRAEISDSEMYTVFRSGEMDSRISFSVQGEENKFTMYFQTDSKPFFLKTSIIPHTQSGNLYTYSGSGKLANEGVYIVSGNVGTDGTISLKCLWVRVWENASMSGTGDWVSCEFSMGRVKSDYETFTDPRDGNVYRTITIGNQTWFVDYLQYEPKVDDGYVDYEKWPTDRDNSGSDKFYTWAENSESAKKFSGVAYSWAAATGYGLSETIPSGEIVRGVCPKGWHIPTAEEWNELIDFLGGQSVAGGKLKSSYMLREEIAGENESGFDFIPGVHLNGQYSEALPEYPVGVASIKGNSILTIGSDGKINHGVVSINDRDHAWYSESVPTGSRWSAQKGGFSIRCIKDRE